MTHREVPSLRDWLVRQDSQTLDLLDRGQTLLLVNRYLRTQWAGEPWIDQIRIANFRGSTLVVYANSAAALVPLRYRKQALLDLVSQKFRLSCTELETKVVPNH